jgi:hypothetical protein
MVWLLISTLGVVWGGGVYVAGVLVLSLAREGVGGKDEGFGQILQVLLVEGFRVLLLGVSCSSVDWRILERVLSGVLRILTE